MLGGACIIAVSSAQSRWVGTGVERSSAGLEGGETRDRGRKTVAGGGSDTSTAVKDGGNREMARLGWMGGVQDAGVGQGVFTGVDGVIGDTGEVCHTDGAETARLRGVWSKLSGWNRAWGCFGGSGVVLRRS
jgi:hypothetical protein